MIPLLYIASPSYSGSTLLTLLLNAHPKVSTVGELKWGRIDPASYQCSCGVVLEACPFWEDVGEEVRSKGYPFDLHRPPTDFHCYQHPRVDRLVSARVRGFTFESIRSAVVTAVPACRKRWSLVSSVNRAVMESAFERSGAALFVDASKDPVRLRHMIATGDYDVRMIQLVRDGRGVVNSAVNNADADVAEATHEWKRTHKEIDRLGSKLGKSRRLLVRYEDVCSDLDRVMSEIFTFVNLSPESWVRDFRTVEHHILGNRMRLGTDSDVRCDEKWRSELGSNALQTFDRAAGKMNRSFGYV